MLQLEQAWWFYEDHIADAHKHLPHFKLKVPGQHDVKGEVRQECHSLLLSRPASYRTAAIGPTSLFVLCSQSNLATMFELDIPETFGLLLRWLERGVALPPRHARQRKEGAFGIDLFSSCARTIFETSAPPHP